MKQTKISPVSVRSGAPRTGTADIGKSSPMPSPLPVLESTVAPLEPAKDERHSGNRRHDDSPGSIPAIDQTPTPEDAISGVTKVDPRVEHIGALIWFACKHNAAQGTWSARIPLDPALLPDTVLHFAYSPTLVTLRFETGDWGVRDLLAPYLSLLERSIRNTLPPSADVVVSV